MSDDNTTDAEPTLEVPEVPFPELLGCLSTARKQLETARRLAPGLAVSVIRPHEDEPVERNPIDMVLSLMDRLADRAFAAYGREMWDASHELEGLLEADADPAAIPEAEA